MTAGLAFRPRVLAAGIERCGAAVRYHRRATLPAVRQDVGKLPGNDEGNEQRGETCPRVNRSEIDRAQNGPGSFPLSEAGAGIRHPHQPILPGFRRKIPEPRAVL